MTGDDVPGAAPEVEAAIVHAPVAEWVSTTRCGIALDTPLLMFANRDGRHARRDDRAGLSDKSGTSEV